MLMLTEVALDDAVLALVVLQIDIEK